MRWLSAGKLTEMKEIALYILWDQQDGYRTSKVYLDKESAEIVLQEHYTKYWILSQMAKVEKIKAVSYLNT